MAVREILLLGNPKLYQECAPVKEDELATLKPVVKDLHDTLLDFRRRYGAGRAVAAPQIGVMKRLVCMHLPEPQGAFDAEPIAFINPVLDQKSEEMMELWDDCMSFPDLLVRVRRHRRCRITYRDLAWQEHQVHLEGALSELLQHECDHLDGVLAVARATGPQAYTLRSQQEHLPPESKGPGAPRPKENRAE